MQAAGSTPSVVIIGAGFAGITVAARLLEQGVTDIQLLEKQPGVGGVWRANTYPGAACDVPSPLYSWSFAPNPAWDHRYARQPQILSYIEQEAARLGVADLVRTGCEVTTATWDDEVSQWHLELADGSWCSADVVISCVGQLSLPSAPRLPGLEAFAGPSFHSAEWDHDVDLRGRRVAVVGTGASAIQFVPAIADDVESITVFQRSAPYVIPKPDRRYTRWHQALFSSVPRVQELERRLTFFLSERLNHTLTSGGWLSRVLRLTWRLHLRRQVADGDLRARLEPDYPMGCKRLLFSNDWYRTLNRPHVDVVTEAISGFEPTGVRDASGRVHPCDLVIFGTGFKATQFLAPIRVTGRDGTALSEVWREGAFAYLGITVPDFPNLFLMYGPNTNLGGSSILGMLEAQAEHICKAIDDLRIAGPGSAVSVRGEAAAAYDDEMQRRLSVSAWTGCSSWYREDNGRITTNWPGLVSEYSNRTRRLDPDHYVLVAGDRA